AAGALDTPAVLVPSAIGGAAVGRNLRLLPVCSMVGSYEDDQRARWGAHHTRIVDEFSQINDGYGFLIEGLQYGPGYLAGGLTWPSGRAHKVIMSGFARSSSWIGLVRDYGGGRVTLDEKGESFVSYPFDEPRDVATMRTAVESMARLHEAAGARMILDLTAGKRVVWRRGQSIDDFVSRGRSIPFHLPYRVLGSAHQMGTARMGSDPAISVADPEGRLHDTAGVWIGDTSAFPTATGANPMLTCMALARRTAQAILATR
ncbi:MAG: GMC family oxidoreductase, partial [Gemmatimonadetes bacterium]|nr:GMC family oxidoreductase [Gemmatimonadota bacterium]